MHNRYSSLCVASTFAVVFSSLAFCMGSPGSDHGSGMQAVWLHAQPTTIVGSDYSSVRSRISSRWGNPPPG